MAPPKVPTTLASTAGRGSAVDHRMLRQLCRHDRPLNLPRPCLATFNRQCEVSEGKVVVKAKTGGDRIQGLETGTQLVFDSTDRCKST